jgi:hypothetical protein
MNMNKPPYQMSLESQQKLGMEIGHAPNSAAVAVFHAANTRFSYSDNDAIGNFP